MEDYREAWEYLSQPRTKHGKVVIETGLWLVCVSKIKKSKKSYYLFCVLLF
jgi:hypothetical protein